VEPTLVCLDTSIIAALIRKDEKTFGNLGELEERGRIISTIVMNLCELYAGPNASRDPLKELEKVQGLVSKLELLELTVQATRR
jgi:predicted nucleic acid-binding protein